MIPMPTKDFTHDDIHHLIATAADQGLPDILTFRVDGNTATLYVDAPKAVQAWAARLEEPIEYRQPGIPSVSFGSDYRVTVTCDPQPAPSLLTRLTALRDELQTRLDDETRSRQSAVEYAIAELNEVLMDW